MFSRRACLLKSCRRQGRVNLLHCWALRPFTTASSTRIAAGRGTVPAIIARIECAGAIVPYGAERWHNGGQADGGAHHAREERGRHAVLSLL